VNSAQLQRLLVTESFVTCGAELSATTVAVVKHLLRSRRGRLSGQGPRQGQRSLDARDEAPGLG
jgi:hypothetical protein